MRRAHWPAAAIDLDTARTHERARPRGNPPLVPSMTHAQLVLAIRRYLELTGWCVLVLPRGGFPGGKGWSDILAFKAARTLFIEAKVGRDKMRPEQDAVRAELVARQFTVIEARSLDDVIRAA